MYPWEELLLFIMLDALILLTFVNFDLSVFNPIRNYDKWDDLNWFGVGVMTLLFNIFFIPYAICYWIYKLFTVGRK